MQTKFPLIQSEWVRMGSACGLQELQKRHCVLRRIREAAWGGIFPQPHNRFRRNHAKQPRLLLKMNDPLTPQTPSSYLWECVLWQLLIITLLLFRKLDVDGVGLVPALCAVPFPPSFWQGACFSKPHPTGRDTHCCPGADG